MSLSLWIRLSTMMFLQFFVWGAWYSVLSVYLLGPLRLSPAENASIMGLLAFASIFMPLIAGQITDRFIPSQVFLGFAHLAGAVGLYMGALGKDYPMVSMGILVWALAYAPTIALTNSLAFAHLKDPEKEFGSIRVLGTIGWIAAGWLLAAWRNSSHAIGGNDCLYLGAAASVVMGLYSFTLPHTPPARSGVSPFAFLKALSLLQNPRILVFLLVSFVVGTEIPFFFNLTPPFLKHLGIPESDISFYMSFGQIAEILTMLALPWFLKSFGPRMTLFIGVLAWPVRYAIFSLGEPRELILGALALHGFCFVFFFVVAFIWMNSVAPKDIRASAQGLLTLVIYGFGMWIGSWFSGWVQETFTENGQTDWRSVFLVPTGLTILCAIVLFATFPRGSMQEVTAGREPDPLRDLERVRESSVSGDKT